jgi:hypothetical protein
VRLGGESEEAFSRRAAALSTVSGENSQFYYIDLTMFSCLPNCSRDKNVLTRINYE